MCSLDFRCEHTLVNGPGETQALVDAARNFVKAEIDNVGLKCPSFQEHLTSAINCYSHAIRVCLDFIINACTCYLLKTVLPVNS